MRDVPALTAVLVISAHWYGPGLAVTANKVQKTIHDFGGFDPVFYEIQYPAPGSPELCTRVQTLLAPAKVALSLEWGLDHGAWTVLKHILPEANVPVIQLKLDSTKSPRQLFEIGRQLAPPEEGRRDDPCKR